MATLGEKATDEDVSLWPEIIAGAGITAIRVSGGTTSNLLTAITFGNANGMSFGISASTMTASHNAITTGMASNRGSDFVQATAAFAGTNATGTIASGGISVSIGNYITTAMDSNRGTDFVQAAAAFAGTSASGTIASNGISVSIGPYITTGALSNHSHGVSFTSGSVAFQTLSFTNSNGISFNSGTQGIFGSHNAITTGRASTDAIGLNTAQTNATWTVNSSGLSLNAGGYAGTTSGFAGTNISGSMTHNSVGLNLALSVAAPGGAATYTNCFEPFYLQNGTDTTSGTLSQLNLQPFILPMNLSFGQINFIGIGTVVPTSASQSYSGRLTNSTQAHLFSSVYSITNWNLIDLFLFSRGSGVFSSELQTFASTRNSFITYINATFRGSMTCTNAAGGSMLASQTVSVSISYPLLTSYTSTSIATNSTYTGWSSGYTTWTSTASNSTTFTHSTSAARTLSMASTYPATVGWSGAKLINFNFGTSLTAGMYWLGAVRHSSTSSSSNSGNSFTGAAGTGNSYSATYNASALTQTAALTIAGKTNTIVNSLGILGFITTNNMAPLCALGSFSGTWASNTTYLNNLGNPPGAVAPMQVRSGVSFFQSWFQLASNRP